MTFASTSPYSENPRTRTMTKMPIKSSLNVHRCTRSLTRTARTVALALLTSSAVAAPAAFAADPYPSRPIKLLVGFPPGGPADIPARLIGDQLSKSLGGSVVVENKPGAGSMIAAQEFVSQPGDGHTLLLCTSFDAINTLLYRKARYSISDLVPISLISTYDYAITVSNTFPAKDFVELVKLSKESPDKFNYGHIGIGSQANIIFKQLEMTAGIKMTALPFKGSAPAVQEVIAGRLDLFIVPPISAVQPHLGKQLRVMAVTGKTRLAVLPDVPTLQELGIPLTAFAFQGICTGKGTPQPVVDKLTTAIRAIVASKEYSGLMDKLGTAAVSSTPAELSQMMNDAIKTATPVVNAFKLQLD